jgi:hypothetical protein
LLPEVWVVGVAAAGHGVGGSVAVAVAAVELEVEPDSADDLALAHHREEPVLDLHPYYYCAFGGNTKSSSSNSRFCPGGVKT